jgi:hypothetical protein
MKRIFFFLCAVMLSISCARGGVLSMVINEWNCVSPTKYLEGDGSNNGTDSYFGHVTGNGDNWVELVVVQDHLDLRGWAINWDNKTSKGVVDSGTMSFTNASIWSDLRQGTIIGLREYDSSGGDIDRTSDISYNPLADDWTIFANLNDTNLITKGHWKIDNDSWKATILNATGSTVEGYVGESGSGAVYQTSGGINSQEVGALGINPDVDSSMLDYKAHGSGSTFLAPNPGQDLSALRSAVVPEPASVVLLLCGSLAIFGVARFRVRSDK